MPGACPRKPRGAATIFGTPRLSTALRHPPLAPPSGLGPRSCHRRDTAMFAGRKNTIGLPTQSFRVTAGIELCGCVSVSVIKRHAHVGRATRPRLDAFFYMKSSATQPRKASESPVSPSVSVTLRSVKSSVFSAQKALDTSFVFGARTRHGRRRLVVSVELPPDRPRSAGMSSKPLTE